MSITIRPCVSGDEAALALVGQATFLETYAGALPAGDIIAHCRAQHAETLYAQWLAKPGYRLWLAEMEAGGAPVGYAALTPPDLPVATGEGDVELKRIYLLNRFHGTGQGGRLMATALESAAQAGFTRMLLGVFGGLIAFGFIGLFIGPTLLAIAYSLLVDWSASQQNRGKV